MKRLSFIVLVFCGLVGCNNSGNVVDDIRRTDSINTANAKRDSMEKMFQQQIDWVKHDTIMWKQIEEDQKKGLTK